MKRRPVVTLLLAWVVGAAPLARAQAPAKPLPEPPAAAPAPAGESIVDIEVEGLRRVEREAALTAVKSRPGTTLDEATLTSDLHAVWQTGFFKDVRVERQRVPGGWRVVFVVVEKPSIREVRYAGHKALSQDDIKGVVDVKPYTILNIDLLKKNTEKIKDLYVQKGYYLAAVSYRIEPVAGAEQDVDVVFDIVENAKVLVKEVSFIGNKRLSADELKGVMHTQEGGELSWLTSTGTYKEEYFQSDLYQVQGLYYDRGFVTVKVGEPRATISPDRRFIYLAVPVEEGEQYAVGKIDFSGEVELRDAKGDVLVDRAKLEHTLHVASGETFNRTKLFNDINALTDVYRDQGYAYANVTPNSALRQDVRAVDLDLEVERGDLVYFDRIEVAGNMRTRDKVIRRELKIIEGERYSSTALNDSRARIYALGYFESVNITTERGARLDRMNVRIEVKEKSTGTFQVGAGFSSVEKFILTAQVSQNNFLGNGWLMSLSAQLSFGDFARRLASLQFYDPYFLDSDWSMGIDAYSTQRFYQDFERDSTGASPRLGYPLTDALRLSVGYTLEKIKVSTGLSDASARPAYHNLDVSGLSSAVNANVTYDTRDNRLFPSSGHFHMLSGELASPAIGAKDKLSFWRAQTFFRYYYPLPLSLVLKLNAELGWVGAVTTEPVQISERFFPGGILSVRGFEPRGLGPKVRVLQDGNPFSPTSDFIIGGNKQAIFNVELEFPIVAAAGIKGVLFADAGNAYNENQGLFYLGTPQSLRPVGFTLSSDAPKSLPLGLFYSVGWGFRWFSPIGPLRFEWGVPLLRPTLDSRKLIFEFTIGNFF